MSAVQHDFHIHTKYLGCGSETMEVSAIVKECERLGVESLAITDHLNTLDKLPLHRPILEDIMHLDTKVKVFFGVELNFLGCDQGFAFSQEVKEKFGFQFAIIAYTNIVLIEKSPHSRQNRHYIRIRW